MIMSINVYIYIYGCVGLCVCSWMDGQGEDLISGIFEAAPECSKGLSLSIIDAKTTQRAVPAKTCETRRRRTLVC